MSNLEIYEAPAELLQPRFILNARTSNQDWRMIPVLFAASMDEAPHARGGCEGWANISCNEPVEFVAEFPDPVMHVVIRPEMTNQFVPKIEGSQIQFTVRKPRYRVIEINHQTTDGRP